jgi:drug/metabolite transporter (DMT)-like permease
MKSSSFAQLLLLGALWGAAFMFLRVAVPEFGAFSMAATRVGMAFLIMLGLCAVLRQRIDFRARWKTYLGVGAVNTAIPFVAYSFAAQHIPAGYSAIANSTTPVWSALIMWLWFKQTLGALKWLGIGFAFAGVLVLVGLQPVALTPMVVAGMLAAVLAASMYATASFLIQRHLTGAAGDSGIAGATGMLWGATMWLIVPGVVFAPPTLPSTQAWGAMLALALFCTAIGYVMFFKLVKTIGPQRASSVAFLFPAFAAFWGWLVLSEPITFNMIAGMALVLLGTLLVSADRAASVVGPATPSTLWERVRDQLLYPVALALAPAKLRRQLAQHIRCNPKIFRAEIESARVGYLASGLTEPVDSVMAELRLTRVADFADPWLSLLRSDAWMRRHVVVDAPERPPGTGALFVIFHFGGGWWMARYFRQLGERISIIMFRGFAGPTASERFARLFGLMRLKWIERICRSPLIVTNDGGVKQKMCDVWRRGDHVYIAADIPPVLVRGAVGMPFFGQTGYFPVTPFELAQSQGVPIYMLVAAWDAATLRPTLTIRELTAETPVARLAELVAGYEALIRARPGAWHLWGEWPLFFQPSPERPTVDH